MKKSNHHAFKVVYNGIMRVIITEVHVSQPSILTGGKPAFNVTRAIWDTGATHTVITPSIVKKLNLKPIGKTPVSGVNSHEIKDTFMLDIALPNKLIIPNVEVIESNINSPESELLIGMDIIQLGDFSISNPEGKTVFSFCIPPHKNPVDLVEKSNRINKRKNK